MNIQIKLQTKAIDTFVWIQKNKGRSHLEKRDSKHPTMPKDAQTFKRNTRIQAPWHTPVIPACEAEAGGSRLQACDGGGHGRVLEELCTWVKLSKNKCKYCIFLKKRERERVWAVLPLITKNRNLNTEYQAQINKSKEQSTREKRWKNKCGVNAPYPQTPKALFS